MNRPTTSTAIPTRALKLEVSKFAHDGALHFLARPKDYGLTDAVRDDLTEVVEGYTGRCDETAARREVSAEVTIHPIGDDPMSEQELELLRKLNAKTGEIERFVAKAYEIGDIDDLDPPAMQRLEKEVEQLIEQHEDALLEGETVEEWRALDQRLAETEIGRLLQERHEIFEQISRSTR
jgi:hypothetical protein